MSLREVRDRYVLLKGERERAERRWEEGRLKLKRGKKRQANLTQERQLLKDTQAYLTRGVEGDLDRVVNAAIADTFPDRIVRDRFKAEFTGSNLSKLSLEMNLIRTSTNQPQPLLGGRGGGLINVVELALRAMATRISNNRPILLLDQPFGDLDEGRHAVCSEFLRGVCSELGLQAIVIFHPQGFKANADNLIAIEQDDSGVARVEGAEVEVEREVL